MFVGVSGAEYNYEVDQKSSPESVDFSCEAEISPIEELGTDRKFKRKIVWGNVIGLSLLHLLGAYGFYLNFTRLDLLPTVAFAWVIGWMALTTVALGPHRLWAHKSYKATRPLQLAYIFLATIAGQNSIWEWVRDHRQHHKFSDSDADPSNAQRGFFFSHIGWLMSRKHPKVVEYGKKIDMSDLEADPIIMFQKRFFLWLFVIFGCVLPTMIPVWLFNAHPFESFCIAFAQRLILVYNLTWLTNSIAHLGSFGPRPYDKAMAPVQVKIWAFASVGEGWHNYHHTFPFDYKIAEKSTPYNFTKTIIDFFGRLGWAWDLREASPEMVKRRIQRTGDGSHQMLIKKE